MSKSVSLSSLAAASKCRRRTIEIIQTMGACNDFSLAKLKNLSSDLGVNYYPVESYCGMVKHEAVTKEEIELRDRMKQSMFGIHYKEQSAHRTPRNYPLQSMAALLLGQPLAPPRFDMNQEFNLDNIQVIIDSMSEAQGAREPQTPEQMHDLINLEQSSIILASTAGYMSAEEMHQHMENEYYETN